MIKYSMNLIPVMPRIFHSSNGINAADSLKELFHHLLLLLKLRRIRKVEKLAAAAAVGHRTWILSGVLSSLCRHPFFSPFLFFRHRGSFSAFFAGICLLPAAFFIFPILFPPPFFAENVKKFSSRRNRRLPFPSIQTEGDAPFLSVDI